MKSGRPALSARVARAVAIPFGPWPFYPVAVTAATAYSLLIRLLVRMNSQPEGAAPVLGMILPTVTMLVVVTVVAGVAMFVVPRLADLLRPRGGEPIGRVRYVTVLLVVQMSITVALIAVRLLVPDGAPPGQIPLWLVGLSTALVAFLAVFIANGLTGYSVARWRQQEEEVRAERALLLAADERVRAETARFLHDAMQSTLLRASMRLSGAVPSLSDPALRGLLEQVAGEIDAVREGSIRGVGRRLSPPLSSTGLPVALRELAETYAGVMQVDIDFDPQALTRFRSVGEGDRLALGVYRIVEQGLQNALKHGRASHVVVAIARTDRAVHLRISADGVPPSPSRSAGTGAAIVNAWLDDLGGSAKLTTNATGGSTLVVELGTEPDESLNARGSTPLA